MNFGELKAYLKSLINRKDIPDALAAQFLSMAQGRLEREVRPAFMQQILYFSPADNDDEDEAGSFTVPTDFLEVIGIYGNDRQLRRVSIREFLSTFSGAGDPCVYLQTGSTIKMRPLPDDSLTIYVEYYASQPALEADDDENGWSVSCYDALLFGAAILAAHHFEDERLQSFNDQYVNLVGGIADQISREDFSGPMSISAAYSFQDDLD